MNLLFIAANVLLALIFAVSALGKIADIPGSRQALASFGLPASLTNPMSFLLPFVELAIASAVLIPASAWWGALAALGLMMVFTLTVAYQLVRGRHPDCHCFGRLSSGPIGPGTIGRNSLFGALAIVTLVDRWPEVRPAFAAWLGKSTPADVTLLALDLVLLAAIVTLAGLMVIAYQRFMRSIPQSGSLVPAVERYSENAVAIPRAPVVGEPAPVLELAGLDGQRTDLAAFVGEEILLVFSRPGCGACKAILSDLKAYDTAPPSDGPRMVLVTRGMPSDNHDYASLRSPVLLAQSRAAAFAFGSMGTPSAVRIDAAGNFASDMVLGIDPVRQLMGTAPSPANEGSVRPPLAEHLQRMIPGSWQRRFGVDQAIDA